MYLHLRNRQKQEKILKMNTKKFGLPFDEPNNSS